MECSRLDFLFVRDSKSLIFLSWGYFKGFFWHIAVQSYQFFGFLFRYGLFVLVECLFTSYEGSFSKFLVLRAILFIFI